MKSFLTLLFAVVMAANVEGKEGTISVNEDINVKLSGGINIDYVNIEEGLLEAVDRLNEAFASEPKRKPVNFFTGRITLRADISWGEYLSGRVELENRSINDPTPGASTNDWNRFGTDGIDMEIEQAYLTIKDWLFEGLVWQYGIQDVRYTNAAWDEPFFLDVTESESAWTGMVTNGTRIRNNVWRDTMEPVGLKASILRYKDSWTLDLFYYTVFENIGGNGGSSDGDEVIYGGVFNILLSDDVRLGAVAVGFSGGNAIAGSSRVGKSQDIYTLGVNGDFFLVDKQLELFGEIYKQFGTLRDDETLTPAAIAGTIDKSASAFQVGGRYTPNTTKFWGEVRYSFYSGDKSVNDKDDETFQSYENVDDFLVVESNDFGLDVDTNYDAWKFRIGYSELDLGERIGKLSVVVKYGVFDFNKVVWSNSGLSQVVRSRDTDIGNELDVDLVFAYNSNFTFYVKAGVLSNSDLVDNITPSSNSTTWVSVVGTNIAW